MVGAVPKVMVSTMAPSAEVMRQMAVFSVTAKLAPAAAVPDATAEDRAARRLWARRFDWHNTAARTLAMYRAVQAGALPPKAPDRR